MLKHVFAVLVLSSASMLVHATCPPYDGGQSTIYGYTVSLGTETCKFKRLEEAEAWIRSGSGTYGALELAFTVPSSLDSPIAQQLNGSYLDYRPYGSLAVTYVRPPAQYLPDRYASYVKNWPPVSVDSHCSAMQSACNLDGYCGSMADELARVSCQVQYTWNDIADHYCWNIAGTPQIVGQLPAAPTAIRLASYADPTGRGRESGELVYTPASSTTYTGANILFSLQQCSGSATRSLEYALRKKTPFFCDSGLHVDTAASSIDRVCVGSGSSLAATEPSPQTQKVVVKPPTLPQTPQPCEGDPCMPGNGNTTTREPGFRYGNISFDLHYASMRQTVRYGGMDRNWSHTFSRRILSSRLTDGHVNPGTGGAIYLQDEEGNLEAYRQLSGSSDTFRSTEKVGAVLKVEARYGGQWDVYNASGIVDVYDIDGRQIASIHNDDPRQSLTIQYVDGSPADAYDLTHWRVASVTDGAGRAITFNYSSVPDYLLTSISANDGTTLMSFGYDAMDISRRLVSTTQFGKTRQYKYNEPAHVAANLPYAMTGLVDEENRRYGTYKFDDWGRVTDSWNGAGANGVHLGYQEDTEVDVTLPSGGMRIYNYVNGNAYRKPDLVQDDDGTVQYTYTGTRIAQKVDKRNVTTKYEYADGLHETARDEAFGTPEQRRIETDWDSVNNRILSMRTLAKPNNGTGALKSRVDYTYDTAGRITTRTEIDPAVRGAIRKWAYSYCSGTGGGGGGGGGIVAGCVLGLLETIDGPRTDVSDVTFFKYYLNSSTAGCATGGDCHRSGDLYSVTNAAGQETIYKNYDQAGRPTRISDPNGVLTDLTYDPRGWVTQRIVRANASGTPSSDDATTTYAYDGSGLLLKTTDPDGVYQAFTYDDAHRLTDVADNLGNRIHYTLDAAGNRTAEKTYSSDDGVNPKRQLSRVYDELNRLQALKNAAGAAILTYPVSGGYDANDNPVLTVDGNGISTRNTYDGLNRLVATLRNYNGSDPETANASTSYTYDARDLIVGVRDPDQLDTTYVYDGLGNLKTQTSPDTGTTSHTGHDAAGNVLSTTDARGKTAQSTYDALNRPTSRTYPTASLNTTFSYDQADGVTGCGGSFPQGRLTTMTDASGSTTYCYDRRGNVTKKTQVTDGAMLVTQTTYTKADRVETITYPSGGKTTYTRDGTGRITGIAWKASPTASPVTLASGVSYLPFGPATTLTFGNGRTLTKTYDRDYAIDRVSGTPAGALTLDLGVDVMGNITNASGTISPPTADRVYQYDPLYRMKSAATGSGGPLEAYSYNKTGDRQSASLNGGAAVPYGYAAGTHHLVSVGIGLRAYDANGNQTSLPGSPYPLVYDDRNRLTEVKTPFQGGYELYRYTYNGSGERVLKLISDALNDRYEVSTWDAGGRLLGVYPASGGGGSTSRTENASVAANLTAGDELLYLDSTPVGLVRNGVLYYVETDHLGTPRQVVRPATNTVVWKWDFLQNTFGSSAPSQDPDGDGTVFVFNLRFPGQYFNAETGLHYNYFRDYDAQTGRYVESDPIGFLGGINTYSYVRSNPNRKVDYTGLLSSADALLYDWYLHGDGGFLDISAWCGDYLADPTVQLIAQRLRLLAKKRARDLVGFIGTEGWVYRERNTLWITSIYSFGSGSNHFSEVSCQFSGDGCCVTGRCALSFSAKDYFSDPYDLHQEFGFPMWAANNGVPFWFGLSCSGGAFSVKACRK